MYFSSLPWERKPPDQTKTKELTTELSYDWTYLYGERRAEFSISGALWRVPVGERVHIDIALYMATFGSDQRRSLS